MNNQIILLLTLLFLFSGFCHGQEVINLTEDLVLTETWVIDSDTQVNGNGFAIVCHDCSPAVRITNSAAAHFEEVLFPRTFAKWIAVEMGASASWRSERMRGHIIHAQTE